MVTLASPANVAEAGGKRQACEDDGDPGISRF